MTEPLPMTTARACHQAWRQLPEGSLDDIIGTGTCLILAPHPDDESLGCGGLIATCVAAGRAPIVAILTDGAASHPNSRTHPPDRLRAVRAQEAEAAVTLLGLAPDRLVFFNQPDTAMPHGGPRLQAIVAIIQALVRAEPSCTAILAPWRHDPHSDHEAASLLATAVAATTGIRHVAYPVWGWTLADETPIQGAAASGHRLEISRFLADKRAAIQAHQSQYGNLITDDPGGFSLPPDLLATFETPYETFLQP
jgi:LmbE family N-acetylglucosaminyl deacetylase